MLLPTTQDEIKGENKTCATTNDNNNEKLSLTSASESPYIYSPSHRLVFSPPVTNLYSLLIDQVVLLFRTTQSSECVKTVSWLA